MIIMKLTSVNTLSITKLINNSSARHEVFHLAKLTCFWWLIIGGWDGTKLTYKIKLIYQFNNRLTVCSWIIHNMRVVQMLWDTWMYINLYDVTFLNSEIIFPHWMTKNMLFWYHVMIWRLKVVFNLENDNYDEQL